MVKILKEKRPSLKQITELLGVSAKWVRLMNDNIIIHKKEIVKVLKDKSFTLNRCKKITEQINLANSILEITTTSINKGRNRKHELS